MILVIEEKADLIVGYANELVRSVSLVFEKPAVVRLRSYHAATGKMRFNRQNLLARDSYTCAYCGVRPMKNGRPDLEELTVDHVVPRAQSKGCRVTLPWNGLKVAVTCWENVVSACYSCNARKADRTPEQAGMKLKWLPRVPTTVDVLRMSLRRMEIPTEWEEYLPQGSPWRGYWTDELSD